MLCCAVHSAAQSILKIEGKMWYEEGLRNLSTSIFSAPNPPPPPPGRGRQPALPSGTFGGSTGPSWWINQTQNVRKGQRVTPPQKHMPPYPLHPQ